MFLYDLCGKKKGQSVVDWPSIINELLLPDQEGRSSLHF